MPPSAQTFQYTDLASIQDLLGSEGLLSLADDDRDGAVSTAEAARYARAIGYATGKVNLYCLPRYEATELAKSWSVWNWATVLASDWMTKRRANPPPTGIIEMAKEVWEELKEVRSGKLFVDDASLRFSMAPAWSNVRVDPRYRLRQTRVERPISERSPKGYEVHRDRIADRSPEPW